MNYGFPVSLLHSYRDKHSHAHQRSITHQKQMVGYTMDPDKGTDRSVEEMLLRESDKKIG